MGGEDSVAAMDVVGDDAELGSRRVQASRIGQRAADIVQSALPVSAHRAQPELVVLRMALVDLGLIDQVHDVVATMARHLRNRADLGIVPGGVRQSSRSCAARPDASSASAAPGR